MVRKIAQYIELRCLVCGKVFSRVSNGKRLIHYEETNIITYLKAKDVISCSKCGSKELKFNYSNSTELAILKDELKTIYNNPDSEKYTIIKYYLNYAIKNKDIDIKKIVKEIKNELKFHVSEHGVIAVYQHMIKSKKN